MPRMSPLRERFSGEILGGLSQFMGRRTVAPERIDGRRVEGATFVG